jgi:hypothetical protein
MIYIEQRIEDPSRETEVEVSMPRADAVRLFHDINRMLSLIDDEVCQGCQLDPSDQGAYDRVNELLERMQRELQIEPDQGQAHQPQREDGQ